MSATLDAFKAALAAAKAQPTEGAMQALRDAQAAHDKYIAEDRQKSEGEAGDAIRRELDDAQRHDVKYGKVDHSTGVAPTVARRMHELNSELLSPLPKELMHNPAARAMLIPSADAEVRSIQKQNDQLAFMLGYAPSLMTNPAIRSALDDLRQRTVNILAPSNAANGEDWIPTYFSPELVADVYLDTTILNAMPRMAMAAEHVQLGQLTSEPTVQRTSGATTDASVTTPLTEVSAITTDNKLLSADRLNVIVGRSDEMDEDSFISVAPMMMQRMVQQLAIRLEDSVVNGATTTTLDNAATAKLWTSTADPRNCWVGLRREAQSNSKMVDAGGTGAFSIADVRNLKATLGKYGSGNFRGRCAFWAGVDAEALLLTLTELITLEKYGPNATILQGEIGKIFGIPVLISNNVYGPYHGTGLNASGVYDDVTKTATVMGLSYLDAYVVGDRRQIRIEEQRIPIGGATYTIASWRGAFGKTYPSAKATSAVLYNMIP